jgi:hypothetical protein
MTVVYLGELSIGLAVPGCSAAVDAGIAGITGTLDNLLAQLTALNAFLPVPIDFTAQLALAQQMVLSVQHAISVGLPVPSLAAQVAIIAAKVAELTASITAITAQLTVLVDLQEPLTAAGVFAYAYDGATADLGNELDSALGGGVPGGTAGQHANAFVMVTTIPATWDAMGQIVKVTP